MEEDKEKTLPTLLHAILKRQLHPDVFRWLEEKGPLVAEDKNTTSLGASFAAIPRKTGRTNIELTAEENEKITSLYDGLSISSWTCDRVARLWLLLQVNSEDETMYKSRINALFADAEMNELTALYSFLPVLAYPESWQFRTTEGIRSNIGTVLESIMYENPYPAKYLDESAWNQLVLKAFFTDKDLNRIIGLDERANKKLADTLIDYAHERQAAHRLVNPQLWRLVARFIDEDSISDIEKLFDDPHVTARRAAVLACYASDYAPMKKLLAKEPAILEAVEKNELNWNSL